MALSLAGCDAAADLAGDAIKDQIRTEFVNQCEQIAQDNNIASENVGPACECAADDLAADAADGSLEVNQARVEELLRSCAGDAFGQDEGAATQPQPQPQPAS
ncbi:MAG: hypothetical protein ACX930_03485 [Erythrobacter sp.]